MTTSKHFPLPRPLIVAGALAMVVLLTGSADADTLGTRAHQRGVITSIDKGVYQLAVDSTMQLNWLSAGDASASRSSMAGNAMLRFFPKPKVGVSGRLGGFYRKNGDTRDLAFTGTAWTNYFLRLGEGMFFAPGVGGGFAVGQRDVPGAGGMVTRDSLFGVVVGAELMAAMYLSPRFSLNAGPDFSVLLASAGDVSAELAGAFKVGAAYSF